MNFRKTMSIVFDIAVFIFMAIIDITKAFLLFMIPRKYKCKSVQGEVVLITGGASGIGRLIAIKLAGLGAHIVIWDIDKSGIEKVVNEIKSLNGNCTGYICDITKKNEVYKIAKTVKKEIGNVTILVNNAGYVYTKTIVDSTDEQIEKIFKTNILSHFWTTKSFLPNMMKNNHGHIVTISSMAGFIGGYRTTGYSTTKYATVGYHKSLFTELNGECKPLLDLSEDDGSTTGISTFSEDDMTEESITTTIPMIRLPRLRRNAVTSSPEVKGYTLVDLIQCVSELTSTLATEAETIVSRSRRDAGTSSPQELTSTLATEAETIIPRSRRDAGTSSPQELTSTLATEAETIVPRSRRDTGTTFLEELTSTLAMVTETIVARSRRDAATTFFQELTSTLATAPETIGPIDESLISTSVTIDSTVQPLTLNEVLNINGLQSLLPDDFNESQTEKHQV
ncbi:hypothetical protein HCN44_010216 [Aphidius gifuensis]|uniref:Short-chain dehydrogenase/reductase 3 n=1 Tax=Aphidius gifuensis TaxID=684658 RepID=A0A834XWY8_APHGI|nr:hypothetical protein HCN44_010216 [Aphidius gifuensis]